MTTTPIGTARQLPRTSDNALLADAGAGTHVELRCIVKDYGPTRVLHGIDLDIQPGEFVSLLGPSGCGKTTALRVLAGLEQATGGSLLFGGQDVSGTPTNKRDIGMVFQAYSLFPHLKVVDNTAFGLRRRGVGRAQATKRAGDALDLVGLGHLADRFPHQLSGGQQQRVAIARALMMEPQVLLFDEPTAALDPEITAQIVSIIHELAETNITQVIVTHEVEVARKTASRVIYMENGHIVEHGDAGCFAHPQTEAFKNYLSH